MSLARISHTTTTAILLWMLLSIGAATAQSYPTFKNTTVNDFANLLPPNDEAALSQQLRKLREDTGVEMTVLTLDTRSTYAANQTLEQFATGVFNAWGIGDKARNDGVLVMVLSKDRAMRVELGAAYGRAWDKAAQDVVNSKFLPAFRNDNYARGILSGSTAVIEQIVMPYRNGETAPKPASKTRTDLWLFGIFAGLATLFQGRGIMGDGLARLRRCPNCQTRSLRQKRRTLTRASSTNAGSGRREVRCQNCDYSQNYPYVISRRSSRSSGGFGGGRSGGGGASGRW